MCGTTSVPRRSSSDGQCSTSGSDSSGFGHASADAQCCTSKRAASSLHALLLLPRALGLSVCLLWAILFCVTGASYGQGTAGAIVGSVVDPSGAAVSKAAITITSLDTGMVRTTFTGAEGTFSVSDIPLGSYQVKVVASGFKEAVQAPIRIDIKSRVRADFHLEVGSENTTVQVSAEASNMLQTDTPETGGIVTRSDLESLPVLDRNFLSLATMLPGTSPGVGSRQAAFNGAALTVSGSSAEANNVMIDGVSNNEEFSGAMAIVPSMDAIQEFKVQTAQYSAEFGRSNGGVVNIALKSGSNQFHGFAFDYLQNDKMDAVQYFNTTKPPLHSNQFGAGLGGPILKDKLFFFGDYQGLRDNSPSQGKYIVPTAAELTGDFSASGYTIYDPDTTHEDPNNPGTMIRDPFPDNQIPTARINSIMSYLFSLWPSPNFSQAGFAQNFSTILNHTDNSNQYDARADYNVNSSNLVSARFSRQSGGIKVDGWLPQHRLDAIGAREGTSASVGYTHFFNPHLFNEAHLGYNYSHYGNQQANTDNVLSQFDIPNLPDVPAGYGYPSLYIRNLSVPSWARPIETLGTVIYMVENTYQAVDNLTYEKGRHSLKFGGEISRLSSIRYQDNVPGGAGFEFDGLYTSASVGTSQVSGLPDALLGYGNDYWTLYVLDKVRIATKRAALYGQDYWRITPKLTVSLGLRWEVNTAWHEHNNYMANFDFSSGNFVLPESTQSKITSLVGGDLPSTFKFVPDSSVYPATNWDNLAPRVGFSYSLTNKVVARGGFGIFYGAVPGNTFSNGGVIAPISTVVEILGDNASWLNVGDGFPDGGLLGALQLNSIPGYYTPLHPHSPYSEKWSGDVQWSPTSRSMLDIGYQGQMSLHNYFLNYNNVATPGSGSVASRRPFPNIGYVLGYIPVNTSRYNALEASFRQGMTHNATLYSAYTLSTCYAYAMGLDGGIMSNPFDASYDWGPCDYGRTHTWTTSFVYNMPTVRGLGRAGSMILRDWQAAGIYTLQSGLPYTVTLGADVLNIGGLGTNRPNVIGNPTPASGQRSLTNWIDASAFATPDLYTWGDAKKNALRGPGYNNLDFSLQRSFPIRDAAKIMLRMESGNIFNHPSFGNPASTYGGSNFGVITGTQNSARTMQGVLRLVF
jgi:hypothetical protein